MKKHLLFILIVLFTASVVSASAGITLGTSDITVEGKSIDELSIVELMDLETTVSIHIFRRQKETGELFSQGAYTVGKDFPEGMARVSTTSRSNNDLFTMFTISGLATGPVAHMVGMQDLARESFLFFFRAGQSVTIIGDDVIVAPYQ